MVRREVGGDARSASGAGGARLGCAGSGRAVLHIRPGPAGGGSAESYGKPAIESRGRPSPMCNIPAAGPRVSRPARHRSARRRVSGFDPKKTYPQARPRPSGRGRGNQHHAKGLTLEERTERGRGDAVEESEAPPRDGDAREDDGHAKGPDLADAAGAASVVDPGSRSSDQSPDRLLIQHLVSWGAVRMRRAAPRHHSSPDPHVSAAHRGPAALGTCGAQKQRSEVVGERRPVGGTAPCPPPAAQSGTTAMTTLGMVRMRRWTSRMCRRLARAALMRARASATSAVWSWPDAAVAGLQMVDSDGGASGAVPGSGGSLSARLPVCSRIATGIAASHHRHDWGRDGGQGAVPPPITPTTPDIRPLRRLRRLLRTGVGCFPLA